MANVVTSPTLRQAMERVNTLQQIYDAETRRCEGVFVSLVVPAALAFAAIAIVAGTDVRLLVFLGAFCAVYAFLLFLDLHAVGLRAGTAGRLQDRLYNVPPEKMDTCLSELTPEHGDLVKDYDGLNKSVAYTPYISAPLKPVISLLLALAVFGVCQIARTT